MKNTKRLLSIVVAVAMVLSMFGSISFVSAATETTVDPFEALKARSIYAVANTSGYTESNLSIRDTGRSLSGNAHPYKKLVDISSIEYNADTKTLTDSSELQAIIADIQAGTPSRTADQVKNVIIFAKQNNRQYITDTSDGPFMLTKATDGTTEKDVWFTAPYARYRAADNGGDTTYNAQLNSPYGPYFVATSDILKGTNELTFVIEFLDKGTAGASILYAKAGGGASTVGITGVGTNTGEWKTVAVSVTDADIAATNDGNTTMMYNKDDFRIQNTSMSISRVMVCKTADYEAVMAGEELPADPDFITDWYQYAVDNGGVYVDAANGAEGTGINAVNYETTAASSYANQLYDLTDSASYAIVEEENPGAITTAQGANINYATTGGADGAWMFKEGTASDGTKKTAMFSTQYATSRADRPIMTGNIYFDITDNLTQADNALTIILEYLDAGSADITVEYVNTSFVDGSGTASLSNFKVARTNTNTWKQAAVKVTNANLGYDITKTALADGFAAIKLHCNAVDTYISKFAVVKTPVVEEEEEPLPEIPLGDGVITDGVDWFNLAAEKGVYIDAANGAQGTGLSVRSMEVNDVDTQLLDLSVAEDLATANTNAALAANITSTGLKYATLHGSDGAWMYKTFKDVGTDEKQAFFTTKHVTQRSDWCKTPGGTVYFRVDSENITATDNDLYVVIEFLDNGTTGFNVQYSTTTENADEKLVGKAFSIPRKDTNYWRTAVYRITDANFDGSVDNTLYADSKHQFRIDANGVDTYITKVAVVKASDVDAAVTGEYSAPEVAGSAPTIWIAGDSTVETLDPAAYPREGWGMEIANFFKEKTYTSTTGVDTTTGAAINVNDGVVVVNIAKGG